MNSSNGGFWTVQRVTPSRLMTCAIAIALAAISLWLAGRASAGWAIRSSNFMPHGYCYRWNPGILWLHVISDGAITLSYYCIPLALVYLVRQRRDLPFNWVFGMFGLFILGCGTTHLMEIWTVWHASYLLAGLIKAFTGVVSVATAVMLVPLLPKMIALPSAKQVRAINQELRLQIAERARAHDEIRRLNADLENRVHKRAAELTEVNKQLEALTAKYCGLLEAAPDAMVVVNRSGEIVLLNVQAEKQFGYRRDELLGQKVKNIVPKGFAERLIADGTRTAAEALAQQIGTGIELSGQRKDGSEFPIEIMLSPLESAEGILVTAAIRDITERKNAQKHLTESEERFRLMVSGVKDYANVMLDPEGRVISWNEGAERLKGYRAEEILGQHFSQFYPAEEARNGIPDWELEQATKTGLFEGEGWRVRKDGSRFLADVVITALRDKAGRLRGFGKITRDITARRKAEEHLTRTMEELKRSNNELEQFAYVASHDLQEPLRMVASYTELLAQRYEGRLDADADEFIAFAVDGCHRMQKLIQDLLSYSRAGATREAPEEISGEDALEKALRNLRATIDENQAIVTHDSLPDLMTDETQLIQVFQNLVGNAIKYRSADSPHVHIAASKNGDREWVFSVRDNGLGIAPEYFERIFVLFQRLHGQREFEGTGIGLAICKKIVERLGGRIWVVSQPRQGSTFYFALPAREGE